MELIPPAQRKRPFPWLLALIVGGILAALAGTSVAIINATRPKTDFESLTIPAAEEALTARIPASGTVVPIQSVNVSPPKAGRLVQLRVEQGDRVEQNQLIAIMENDDIQAKGMQANANFQQAVANLNAAKVRIPGEIAQARARYDQAEANVEEAKQRLDAQTDQAQQKVVSANARYKLAALRAENRNETLQKEGAISRETVAEALSGKETALAELNEAVQHLQEFQATNAAKIAQLEAAVKEARIAVQQREASAQAEFQQLEAAAAAAQAQLQQVKIEYDQTGIRAPFAGIVTQKYANPGSFVTPTTSASGAASATSTSIIALARGLEIVAKVPEVDVGQLRPGQPVEIAADAYPDKIFRGLIKQVAPEAVIDQNVTSFEVRVAIDDKAEKELRSGMNVDLTFIGERLANAVVVPTVAIVTDKGKRGVMVIGDDNKPKFREAKIGLTLGDKTQILEGLKPGERVFTDLPEGSQPKNDEE